MDFTRQLLDPTILNDDYPIGILVCFHESLLNAQTHFTSLSQNPSMFDQFTEIMQQLKVIEHNLAIMDCVIDNKKTIIVYHWGLPEPELQICLN
jgi:hypothetical protein